jgi:Undecaprenyl-phosphate glucose phosphotransferase
MSTVTSTNRTAVGQGAPGLASGLRPKRLGAVLYRIVGAEFATVFVAAFAAMGVYYWVVLHAYIPLLYVLSAFFIAALIVLISVAFRHYVRIQSHRKRWYVSVGIGAAGLAFSLFLTLLFLFKFADEYSRGAFLFQLMVVSVSTIAVRAAAHNKLRASIRNKEIEARRVILIGRTRHCQNLTATLAKSGLRLQAIIPFHCDDTCDGSATVDFRQVVRQCRPLSPDDILIVAKESDLPDVERLTSALSELPASIHMMPIGLENILASSKFAEVGLVPTIQLLQQPLSLLDRIIKRTFDLAVATIGLLLLCPLFTLVAVVIKLESRGPAIFRQARHGFNNETIRVFKFRTMRTIDTDTGFKQAIKDDPRITAFGKILRRTNIDELPQLVNVLFGEMSLVGPRPHPIALNLQFEDKLAPLFRRHNVKPGITGWAQVNGCRGETDTLEKMQNRLRHDLYYIDHWSFLLDLQIIMMTLVSKKAYSNAY